MADIVDPTVVLTLQSWKHNYSRFKSYSFDSSYLTPTDGWEVTMYEPLPSEFWFVELHPVEILMNGHQQVLGRVDVSEIGRDGAAITLRGRDYLADLTECNVDPALKITEGMTVEAAIKLAAGPVGITEVENDDDSAMRSLRTGKAVGGKVQKEFRAIKLAELKPEPGLGIFEWCNKLASRHGATIQPSNRRSAVVLSAPNYKQSPLYGIRRTTAITSEANNVKSAYAVRDFSRMPTVVLGTGSAATGGDKKTETKAFWDMATLAAAFSPALAPIQDLIFELRGKLARRKPGEPAGLATGLLYRLLYFQDTEAKTAEQVSQAAKRAIAERLKDTLAYRVTLRGHTDPETGALWAVNTMVHVQDSVCNLDEPLWIEKRAFRNGGDSGAVTELECWRPESFQIG